MQPHKSGENMKVLQAGKRNQNKCSWLRRRKENEIINSSLTKNVLSAFSKNKL